LAVSARTPRNSLSALAVAPETIDAVADAIVAATATLFEDFDVARTAARAAIAAFVDAGGR